MQSLFSADTLLPHKGGKKALIPAEYDPALSSGSLLKAEVKKRNYLKKLIHP